MDMHIKDEPIEPTDQLSYHQSLELNDSSTSNVLSNNIDDQFDTELIFLNKIYENVFNLNEEDENLLNGFHSQAIDCQNTDIIDISNDGLISQVLLKSDKFLETREKLADKCSTSDSLLKENNVSTNKPNAVFNKENLLLEKKKVLMAILESTKSQDSTYELIEPLSKNDEKRILNHLINILDQNEMDVENEKKKEPDNIIALRRLKCKLELRNLKRKKHQNLFDIDSYVNELIDKEKFSMKKTHSQSSLKPGENNFKENNQLVNNHDNEVIFEKETLKTSLDSSCEIIAVKQVLDRFKFTKADVYDQLERHKFSMPIGLIEIRNEDVKCLISPLTKKYQIDYFLFLDN
jgi:hypothetical protein